ncbi:MAG: alpha-glucosidase [Mogibacterium sp.]|nr:alpha-glucosidase [Mogibacterium sp.]
MQKGKAMAAKTNWYKEAVVYQVYPLSFKDSNNDGMGDIPGIISKLDYIRDLGATAVWFSPLYASPWKDYGYDISDYRAIHPAFGTMEDFDRLVAECHARGLRVIMDAVFNHTSSRHAWFRAALSDPDSPYRDYYIIRKGRIRKDKKGSEELIPPTNWTSSFTGSAWERILGTDEYYLHLFAPDQPDLNWENPAVREEMADILRFWLDRGVDGFRFDVFNLLSKEYPLRDDRNRLHFQKGTQYFVDGPRMHEFLNELNEKALSLYDTYTVGESYTPDEVHAHRYIHEESGELDTIFDFGHMTSDNVGGMKFIPRPFSLIKFKRGLIDPQLRYHGTGWNTLVLENHDCVRCVSRFGINDKKYRYEAATFLPVITYFGWGTPFIYQGQEIGMTNAKFRSMRDLKDPVSHFVYDTMTEMHIPARAAEKMIMFGARDHARTPMQWDGSANAGFNEGTAPWQCMNPNYRKINVEADLASDKSIYRFYQKVLEIRRSEPALLYGRTIEYYPDDRQVIAYSRDYGGKRFLIVGNFSASRADFIMPGDFELDELSIRLTNLDRTEAETEEIMQLKPYEALLFEENKK